MPDPDFSLKAHDRRPAIQAALSVDGLGVVNLSTAAGVKFLMAPLGSVSGPLTVNGTATIASAAQGVVSYSWGASDTATPGTYQGEWEVTWSDGTKQTFPTQGYHTIQIYPDLNAS